MSEDFAFALDDAALALGLTKPAYVENFARVTLRDGQVIRQLWRTPPDYPGASSSGWLLSWPSEQAGLIASVISEATGANPAFVACWPFASYGVVHRMQVDAPHSEQGGILSAFCGSIQGVRLSVFDTFCGAISRDVRAGDVVSVRVHGWATSLRRSKSEPIRIDPTKLRAEVRETFGELLDPAGMIVLRTEGVAAIFPALECDSPLYKIYGLVKAVRLGGALLGRAVWVLTVAVARPDDQDLDVDVSVTSGVWEQHAPAIGDDVEGVVWLQASFD